MERKDALLRVADILPHSSANPSSFDIPPRRRACNRPSYTVMLLFFRSSGTAPCDERIQMGPGISSCCRLRAVECDENQNA